MNTLERSCRNVTDRKSEACNIIDENAGRAPGEFGRARGAAWRGLRRPAAAPACGVAARRTVRPRASSEQGLRR
ncbi:unnamed protein product [Arctia plantaginis]|uniref:Uncharacterized protein n=1 Tax=Arctia plantaginis TaxID=874455 RepID=A0A8S1B0Q8_ARCPL|nr:unnamed protein product [Arctia plantaginis]